MTCERVMCQTQIEGQGTIYIALKWDPDHVFLSIRLAN